MENKYIYKTKFVKTPEQYIAAVNKGYCVIDYPKEIKEPLLKALKKAMKDSLDLQCAYLIVKTDGRASKMGLKRNFLAVNKLAEQGNLKAINCTGVVYSHYYDDRAYFRYKKAADAGFAIAKCNLAIYYEDHREYELYIDNNAHRRLYLEAADAGLARAQYIYGARFADDLETQLRYLYAAAKQKYVKAYIKLGEVVPDIDEQLYWFKKALKEGHTEVYDSIAYIYKLKDDSKKAVFYYIKSMRCGNENSAHVLISIYPNLISKKVRKEAEKVIYGHERKFKRNVKKAFKKRKKEEEKDDAFLQYVHEVLDSFDYGKPANSEDSTCDNERNILDEAEEFNAVQKSGYLGMSQELMDEIILACYSGDDEEGTFARIADFLKELESKQNSKMERFIFKDLKLKFDNTTYSKIAEYYNELISKEED